MRVVDTCPIKDKVIGGDCLRYAFSHKTFIDLKSVEGAADVIALYQDRKSGKYIEKITLDEIEYLFS